MILFSGRARNDLRQQLVTLGWRVCSVDTVPPKPTNLLDEGVWAELEKDLADGILTPSSWQESQLREKPPLREKPAGPRPLGSVDSIAGLQKNQLTMAEQSQLKEANILVSRSASAIIIARERKKQWGLENPDHPEDKPSLWLMHSIKSILKKEGVLQCKFDQCRMGLETTKPTIIAHEGIDLSALHQLRCDHLKVQQETADGKKYMADHSLKALWPEVSQISRDILLGRKATSWEQSIKPAVRQAVLKVLPLKGSLPDKAARASTPLCAEVFKGPKEMTRSTEGWTNYSSAVEEAADLQEMIADSRLHQPRVLPPRELLRGSPTGAQRRSLFEQIRDGCEVRKRPVSSGI